VEMNRAQNESQKLLAGAFDDWGFTTAEAILNVRQAAPQLKVIASGGLRSGIEIAKCLALGAILGGMASPFLKTAVESFQKTVELIEITRREIQICLFGTGAGDISTFQQGRIVELPR